jgi:predicted DNA-binding transcriptional regulator YafY
VTDTAGRLLRLLPLLLDEDSAAAIDQVLPPRLRRRVEALTVATVPLVPAEPSIEPNDLALVALTCQQSERLRFRYRNGSGQDSHRHVEPHRLVYTRPALVPGSARPGQGRMA